MLVLENSRPSKYNQANAQCLLVGLVRKQIRKYWRGSPYSEEMQLYRPALAGFFIVGMCWLQQPTNGGYN